MSRQIFEDLLKEIEKVLDKEAPAKFRFYPEGTSGFTIFGGSDKLIIRTGRLRDSFVKGHADNYSNAVIKEDGLTIIRGSKVPYARLHEFGGMVAITPKMRNYFWFLYFSLKNSDFALAKAFKNIALFKNFLNFRNREYLKPALGEISKLVEDVIKNKIKENLKLEIKRNAQDNSGKT